MKMREKAWLQKIGIHQMQEDSGKGDISLIVHSLDSYLGLLPRDIQ